MVVKEEQLVNLKEELEKMCSSKSLLEESVSLLKDEMEIIKYQNKIVSLIPFTLYSNFLFIRPQPVP